MADSDKTPRPKVELDGPDQSREASQKKAADTTQGVGPADAAAGFARVSAWVSRTFPGHENAFWGGVCGLLVALVLLTLGILKTAILVVLVVAGIAVGQLVDGDPKLIRALQRIFSNNQ